MAEVTATYWAAEMPQAAEAAAPVQLLSEADILQLDEHLSTK